MEARVRKLARLQPADTPHATAVFCGNDEIEMGVIRGLTEHDKSVAAGISVVGFDDHPIAAACNPALTTVRHRFASLIARAVALLEDLGANQPIKKVLLGAPSGPRSRDLKTTGRSLRCPWPRGSISGKHSRGTHSVRPVEFAP